MKNLTIRKLFILAGILLLSSAGIVSAETTATLLLQGKVDPILEISVSYTNGNDTLDLSSTVSRQHVATITERSNNRSGYTVSLSSANAAASTGNSAFLKGLDTENADTLSYSIVFGGSEVSLSGGSAVVSEVNGKTGLNGTENTVEISYTGAFLNADTYQDTLTFTIAAK